jgi:hypothetical protein
MRGIVLCAGAAVGLSFAVSLLATPLPGLVRFLCASTAMVLAFSGLLARFEGVSPRTIIRSLRGK